MARDPLVREQEFINIEMLLFYGTEIDKERWVAMGRRDRG